MSNQTQRLKFTQLAASIALVAGGAAFVPADCICRNIRISKSRRNSECGTADNKEYSYAVTHPEVILAYCVLGFRYERIRK